MGSRKGLQGGDSLEGGILWQAGHILSFSVFPACSVKGDEVEGFLLAQAGGESLRGLRGAAGPGDDISVLHGGSPTGRHSVCFAGERKGSWGPRHFPLLEVFSQGTHHTSGT